MTDAAASRYRVSAPGYIDTPGRSGNNVSVARPALTGPIDSVEWIVRFRMDSVQESILLGWGAGALTIGSDLRVTMVVTGAGGPIGNMPSNIFPNLFANVDTWVKARLTIATAKLEYWYSFDAFDPQWKVLGEATGTNAGTAVTLASTTPFRIGAAAATGGLLLDGRVFFVQENINDVQTLRFDGNQDLRGIPYDAPTFTLSAPVSGTPPVGITATVNRDANTPKLILVQPSLDRPWWPLSTEDDPQRWYQYPAFTVQREIGVGGDVRGGDTVRGSTSAVVEKTALRYPSSVVAPKVVQGKGLLFTRVHDYNTVQIQWGLAEKFTDKWYAAAIVRSAFGYPVTVNDGQIVYRGTKSQIFPNGQPDGSITFPDVYDMVRPPQGDRKGLPSGYWYYYSLFFQVGRKWYRSMVSSSLVPRDHNHATHLWNALPPYYQWADDQQREENGDLRQFLKLFGFELDTTREFVESWQKLYWVDFSPMRLLRRVGANFDLPYEAGIGDVRYRSLLAEIGKLYSLRGTRECLERVVEAVSKCECDVTTSPNVLLLPDDSDFFEGTGHWAGKHPGTSVSGVTALHPSGVALKTNTTQQVSLPVSGGITYGRGSASMWTKKAVATTDVVLTLGDGINYPLDASDEIITDQPRSIVPRESAIHVQPQIIYGFSIWLQPEIVGEFIDIWLMWFTKDGQPDDLVNTPTVATGISKKGKIATSSTNWVLWEHFAEAPAGAKFCVPAVHFSGRPAQPDGSKPNSPVMHLTGASFYALGTSATVARFAPDQYLTMGSQDLIGAPTATPPAPVPAPFEGFVIGKKEGS